VVGKYQIEGKKERKAIQAEIEQFLRAGAHTTSTSGVFHAAYPQLQSRGATWSSKPFRIPYFNVSEGASGISGSSQIAEVRRVLDQHRCAAKQYRPLPLWITLLLTDRWEHLRDTISGLSTTVIPLAPFDRCYVADDTGRVLEFRQNRPPAAIATTMS
jgi:hypothetical protein